MRTNVTTKILIGLLIAASASSGNALGDAAKAEDTPIEKYTFTWHLVKVGKFSLTIEKNQDTTSIWLHSDLWGFVQLTPEQAESIGDVLKQTDAMRASLKGAAETKSETVKAKDYNVTFRFSKVSGFSVTIAADGRLSGVDRIRLDRDFAVKAQPFLSIAGKLIAKVDATIKP